LRRGFDDSAVTRPQESKGDAFFFKEEERVVVNGVSGGVGRKRSTQSAQAEGVLC